MFDQVLDIAELNKHLSGWEPGADALWVKEELALAQQRLRLANQESNRLLRVLSLDIRDNPIPADQHAELMDFYASSAAFKSMVAGAVTAVALAAAPFFLLPMCAVAAACAYVPAEDRPQLIAPVIFTAAVLFSPLLIAGGFIGLLLAPIKFAFLMLTRKNRYNPQQVDDLFNQLRRQAFPDSLGLYASQSTDSLGYFNKSFGDINRSFVNNHKKALEDLFSNIISEYNNRGFFVNPSASSRYLIDRLSDPNLPFGSKLRHLILYMTYKPPGYNVPYNLNKALYNIICRCVQKVDMQSIFCPDEQQQLVGDGAPAAGDVSLFKMPTSMTAGAARASETEKVAPSCVT